MEAKIDTEEFKEIPFFRKYVISRDGVVINTSNGKTMKPKGKSVQVTSDREIRTTRTIKGLLNATWGKQ